jgi:hypothetical protein
MSSAPAEPGPSLDRNPPQDIDAEKSVLGAMLSSKDAIADVVEEIKGVDNDARADDIAALERTLELLGYQHATGTETA